MLVAVIDDGIMSEMFSVCSLRYDMTVTERGLVRSRRPTERIATPHGTTVAGIIRKYSPNAELCSVKVFPDNLLKTTCIQLIAALNWCLKKDIPLINLSLGTIEPEDFRAVSDIIDKLLRNGTTIVAACNNNGKFTLPAMHRGVHGVQAGNNLVDDQFIVNPKDNSVRYIASSSHELVFLDEKPIRTPITNSYAAPTVTAAFANGKINVK